MQDFKGLCFIIVIVNHGIIFPVSAIYIIKYSYAIIFSLGL